MDRGGIPVFSAKPPTGLFRNDPIRKYALKEQSREAMGSKIPFLTPVLQAQVLQETETIESEFIWKQRTRRRSKSVNCLNQCVVGLPGPGSSVSRENLANICNLPQSSLTRYCLLKKSSSLYSLNSLGINDSLNKRTISKNAEKLKETLTSIYWYLHLPCFGFNEYELPEKFPISCEFLTGRKYLDICVSVASKIVDINYGCTDNDIICNILKVANSMKYPGTLKKSTLISPMTPVDQPVSITFLHWLCRRVYDIKYQERPSTGEQVIIKNPYESFPKMLLNMFRKIGKPGKDELDEMKTNYLEYLNDTELQDFESLDDLMKLNNDLKNAVLEQDKISAQNVKEIQLAKDFREVEQNLYEQLNSMDTHTHTHTELDNVVLNKKSKNELDEQITFLKNEINGLEKSNTDIQISNSEMRVAIDKINLEDADDRIIMKTNLINKNFIDSKIFKTKIGSKLLQECSTFINTEYVVLNQYLKILGLESYNPETPEDITSLKDIIRMIEKNLDLATVEARHAYLGLLCSKKDDDDSKVDNEQGSTENGDPTTTTESTVHMRYYHELLTKGKDFKEMVESLDFEINEMFIKQNYQHTMENSNPKVGEKNPTDVTTKISKSYKQKRTNFFDSS